MSIRSLAHVCIMTRDLDATADFYCGILGMKKMFNFTKKGKIIGFYMRAANQTFVEAFHADEIDKMEKPFLSHFCLETDDVHGLRKLLDERGFAPREMRKGADNSFQFWMKDPNGIDIEFQEYSDQSSQVTGRDVEVNW